ncbi:fl(2)d-associated complex component-like isoform X2 [Homalodisca vitripennis]|uniref:fl(2)d-associated complex component-like isoform X2 n=1 Tax=Homalodisca vitripennis TaxID=197043 RepID=UPI001EEC55B3|nr:fl(2)d-associated complex component-like isoform X2 [Homalodisca vitripennis]
MSKVTKRKITVESPGSKLNNSITLSNSITNKDSQRRQSVFERLGTKTGASISINTAIVGQQPSLVENFCRHWNQNGTCPYGKNCVFVNTHTLISPSKRVPKKDLEPKQALEGLRLHSTVVKRGSPDLSWESWDQTELEYEDEKVLERRRQLLQRELELQMRREETEEHHTRHRHTTTKPKKGLSSSSSTSVSSTSSESSSSSDESSSDSSSSGIAGDNSKRRSKPNKTKRGSTSSVSDTERNKIRESNKSMHKDRSPSNISRKSTSSRDKRGFTPPRKPGTNIKMTTRKKSPSPSHRRHNTPTSSSKSKPSTSKSSVSSRPGSKRSVSTERKDKHKRSQSPPRPRSSKTGAPRRPESRPRRSPDTKPRNTSRSRLEDRKKDDDRSRSKDDRRQDRKTGSDRDKRDHEDARAREKAREAREKEREEALERCRERQREREQLARDKERTRERPRDDRDKDKTIPPLMSLPQQDRKALERDRDRATKDRKDRDKERDKDKDRDRDRLYDRNVDKSDRSRPLEKERLSEKIPERDRISDKDRPRDRDNLSDRREKGDRDRSFERDRNFDNRNTGDQNERAFDRDKDRQPKGLDRSRDRDFDREKERGYERVPDNRRSFEKVGDRDRTSLEKDRGIVRDRGLDRVMEIRERNKSMERGRVSDGERNTDRGRDRFDRRTLAAEDKGYESPYDSRRERPRYGGDGPERPAMFKDHSPSREDSRSMRMNQGFSDDRRSRGGRGTWESRDWDYPDSRRDWDSRNRHGEWEGSGVEGEAWGGRWGGGGGDWREEWPQQQHRPPRHPPREEQTIVSANHIVVRDTSVDDSGGRRSQAKDIVDKDSVSGDFKKDNMDTGSVDVNLKRGREGSEGPVEAKKPRLEETSAMLEEALSDISDDPDEILNREDIDMTPQDSAAVEEDVSVQPSAPDLDQRLLEDRPSEEENIDNLDFEEISDEELEEEARANKGLGDALGVDWASLVAESRPRVVEAGPGAARRRWQPENILARIGVSMEYAGVDLFNEIHNKLTEKKGEDEKGKIGLLHPVASLHVTLRDKQARRRCLFSGADTFKRALSARADLAIRRQLCNLPVASLEMQQASGFCQWVV